MEARRKRLLFFVAKLAVSAGILFVIFTKVFDRQETAELGRHLASISWPWLAVAAVLQIAGIACSITRWNKLLVGQGIHAPIRHLIGSFMIGRFFGAFTPGGWTGLNGYRIYDIAKHTGKTARAAATIGIEMLLGQIAFGAVVIAGSIFGLRYIGLRGVLLVDGLFIVLILGVVALVSRPLLFRKLGARLPRPLRARLSTTLDAVCAYEGKSALVVQAAGLGMGTHACHTLVYAATAHALGVDLGVGEVVFVSAMQIFATLMPASLNGIGLREAAAVALYTRVGVPASEAVLIPMVGFAVEMAISSLGGLVFLARRVGYEVDIRVDDAEREELAAAAIADVPAEEWPRVRRGLTLGLGAGLLAGLLLGVGEAVVILVSSHGRAEPSVLLYGAVAYALVFGPAGAVFGAGLAWTGRLVRRPAVREPIAYARMTAAIVAPVALVLGAFRVRRDVYDELLVWKSAQGLVVLAACIASSVALYVVLYYALRWVVEHRPGRVMLRAWGSPAVLAVAVAAIGGVTLLAGGGHVEAAPPRAARPAPPAQAGNVVLIVVDTLRADHLPIYGYERGRTPNLDAFARDAVRFENAFANASWTRPSFASILTGRYPATHRVMNKDDSLSDELVTLPEALGEIGYHTSGFVTNYNIAPFFNFQQGFDEYRYLEPNFVLGANDTAAKLLLIQFARQRIETWRASHDLVAAGTAYQDAATVNREVFRWLARAPQAPWFLFVAYMDPHDPYLPHPYNGHGYARAAHAEPAAEEAPELVRLYDGEITYWDGELGRLLAELRRRGVYDDATIVIASDHGEEFHEHGGFWHGTTLYDEQVRVPLFVKLPFNQHGGRVISHWAQLVDVMPTLLRLAGGQQVSGVQGHDMFQASTEVFAEESHEGNVLRSLRTRRGASELKIITANAGNPRGLPEVELFRVDQDRHELVDLSSDRPEELAIARERLSSREREASRGAVERSTVDVAHDQASQHQLHALGYAGDGTGTPRPAQPSSRRDAGVRDAGVRDAGAR